MVFTRNALVVAVGLLIFGMARGAFVANHPQRRLAGNGDPTSRINLPLVRSPLQLVTCPNSTPPPDGAEVQADEAKGFYWPYLLYIPPASTARQILVRATGRRARRCSRAWTCS